MSSDRLPPHYPPPSSERPLDLTVKRSDMESNGGNNAYTQHPQFTQGLSPAYSSTSSDYNTQGEPCSGYYDTNQQYQSAYTSDSSSTSSAALFQSPAEPIPSPSSFYSSPPVHPYERDASSCVLPKKRKNLWRPYDSRAACQGLRPELEKEVDSSSDSGSSSSEQEFKTPATPMDPMKKRKRNMLRYAEEQFENSKDNISAEQSCSSSSQINVVQPPKQVYNNTAFSSQTNTTSSYLPPQGSLEEPETRDNLISEFKTRDVFGWSLKLQKPSENISEGVSQVNTESSNVCMDGDKTYIELQTVKKQQQSPEKMSDSKLPPTSTASKIPASPSHGKKNARKSQSPNKHDKQEVTNENDKNSTGGRVFIQRRDNVIESFDETQNVPKKEQTKKNICLIDLIEEIEADTLKREALEETKQKNNNVVKLLEQCNFVKLQALDYLMANVLIQDNGPSFKNKNETVQKMLKGDKIGCVNMLDIVELQVEIGLN